MGRTYFIRFSILFWIIALVHLVSNFYKYEIPFLRFVSKPAIVLSLLVFFVILVWHRWSKTAWLVSLALIFSLIGDLFLLFEDYFLFGLASFLLAHLFYSVAFTRTSYQTHDIPLLRRYMLIPLGFIMFGIVVFLNLKPKLGEMLLPVVVYIGVVLTMAMLAANRYGKVKIKSFAFVLLGALLFLLSDSVIAFDKFNFPIENAHLYIMSSYIVAQYFIVIGMIRQIRKD